MLDINRIQSNPEELKEIDSLKSTKKKNQNTTNLPLTLTELAEKGVKQIGAAADIRVEKSFDYLEDATTYALAVGKKFSIKRVVGNK